VFTKIPSADVQTLVLGRRDFALELAADIDAVLRTMVSCSEIPESLHPFVQTASAQNDDTMTSLQASPLTRYMTLYDAIYVSLFEAGD
jgi:hypothetical protein